MKRAALLAALALAVPAASGATSRDEVMARAKAYAFHPWRCQTANLTASCSSAYQSIYQPGDYLGLPYDWGGYMTLSEFDQQISQGYGAGSYPDDGILACTSGVDCSGFVSKAWNVGHFTTSNLNQTSSAIAKADVLPGDAFNLAGTHVVLYSHTLANGEPVLFESAGYNVHRNASGGWSYISTYTPMRLNGITGTTALDPLGTTQNPIVIPTFPYRDSRDTRQSLSDLFDRCGAAPGTDESGREFVYKASITVPGKLTVSITDDANTDVDPHLYTSFNTLDCIARNDSTFSVNVDCGTYFVLVDTYHSSAGDQAGPYTLNVTFTPGTAACGNGPPSYDFGGGLREPCAYPGHDNLPFCNENLGSEICLYSSSPPTSFCTKACTVDADCPEFPGGCCLAVASGETYCAEASLCGNPGPDAGVTPPVDAGLPRPDASTARPDAGTPPDASAVVPPDASVARPDASAVRPDAGSPPPGPDASTPVVAPDASAPGRDASAIAPPPDAAEARADAGVEPAPEGCGCATTGAGTPAGAMLVLAILALGARRKDRR